MLSGNVTFADVLKSEQAISGSSEFASLRYVISDYTAADYQGINESQQYEVNALRIGSFFVNKHIKYAFVIHDSMVKTQMKEAITNGLMLFETGVFDAYQDAAAWVAF